MFSHDGARTSPCLGDNCSTFYLFCDVPNFLFVCLGKYFLFKNVSFMLTFNGSIIVTLNELIYKYFVIYPL